MDFVILQSFNNYMDAHLLMGRLESEGIECWLQDENTVTINPVWTNAVGGIKLLVKKEDAFHARQILWEIETNRKQAIECPKCKGHNIELVSTPRKASNWFSAVFTFFIGDYALTVDKVNHCFDCGHEFENVNETSTEA
jgi:predicted Zn-ribbon and HTH transcriptional regulator